MRWAEARRSGAGVSVGTYLVLAAPNRLADPCSRRRLRRLVGQDGRGRPFTKVPASVLDHRRFWDAMKLSPWSRWPRLSRRIALRMVSAFELDRSSVALDMTNFATFIDTGNGKAPVAQRGRPSRSAVTCAWSGWAWS